MLREVIFNALVIGAYLGAFLTFLIYDDQALRMALLRVANTTSTGIIAPSEDITFIEEVFLCDLNLTEDDNASSVINSVGRVTGL